MTRKSWHHLFPIALVLTPVFGFSTLQAAEKAPALAERLQLCAGCHNSDGNSTIPDYPKLSGLASDYIERQLSAFKSGERVNPIMNATITAVNESEFEALAEYFSEQKRNSGDATDEKLVAKGKVIFQDGIAASAVPSCGSCHNDDGSGSDKYPRLAGQHSKYVIAQLQNFKEEVRKTDSKAQMRAVAKRLQDIEIQAVASYIQSMKGE